LLLNARNDPFLPASALPTNSQVSANIRCDFPEHGGHVGFLSGTFPGNSSWMARRVFYFFEHGD
jgi:predicted alpha/beta-fold hydrolase